MKITISPTTKIVIMKPAPLADGIPARVWEGETESGIKVRCFITRVAVDKNEPRIAEFENELKEVNAPSYETSRFPSSLIL